MDGKCKGETAEMQRYALKAVCKLGATKMEKEHRLIAECVQLRRNFVDTLLDSLVECQTHPPVVWIRLGEEYPYCRASDKSITILPTEAQLALLDCRYRNLVSGFDPRCLARVSIVGTTGEIN